MSRSGDLVIGRSGDRETELTAETRRRGESENEHTLTAPRSTSAPSFIAKALRTLRATLREIFDESAYDRFLLRTHASRSIASYREFTSERDAAIVKKPRCC